MTRGKFYVTTPLYYVNDAPHIGHAYTTVLADVLARFHRMRGDETWFLTGTDEHGQKILESARQRGLEPLAHCDSMVERFQQVWRKLQISYDDFIRTTEERHQRVVQQILTQLWEGGRIYQATYEGLYCIPDERYWTEKDIVDGKCPLCGRPVVPLSEKNYFFRMSEYQDWLIRHIEEHPGFIQPEYRRNEVLGFLRKPLGDLCISRPVARLSWGIPIPFDPEYVTYVWFDALINYYSAVATAGGPGARWPASLHLIGKDILTTHAVYWPTMLQAAGLAQPESILAHGWWLSGEQKMSKSVGNVVQPLDLLEVYGVDAFRYFLMRDMVVGLDAAFSEAAVVGRINADLANDLGNCLNRVERMIHNYCQDRIPAAPDLEEADRELIDRADRTVPRVLEALDGARIHQAIEETMELVRAINRYLEIKAPWKAVKETGVEGIAGTLAVSAEGLRLACTLLSPVMPGKMGEALHRLGVLDSAVELLAHPPDPAWLRWGVLQAWTAIRPGTALFPRIETKPAP